MEDVLCKFLSFCLLIQVASSQFEDLDVIFSEEFSVSMQKWNDKSGILKHFGVYNPNSRSDSAEISSFDLTGERDFDKKCTRDLFYIQQNRKKQWAIQYFDSIGKIESGIVNGNLHWLGEYDECINVYAPPKQNSSTGNFHGKYCLLQLSVLSQNSSTAVLPISIGICVPDSCTISSLNSDIAKILTILKIIPYISKYASKLSITVACKATSKQLNAPAIGVISMMCVFGILVLCGSSITIWEYIRKIYFTPYHSKWNSINSNQNDIKNENDSQERSVNDSRDTDVLLLDANRSGVIEKVKAFFKCFCVFNNGAKILNTDATEGQLLSIHGIRFLSMTWVILGHTYGTFANIRNPLDALHRIDNFPFQIVLQGFFSVDSFFVLSGFLLTYLFLNEITKKKGNISWAYFYVHRFLRLTPVYMIVLGFYTAVFRYLLYGPYSFDGDIDPVCQKNWWWNLLYINNFPSATKQCMAWSWYLANDMQFYVISPIILYSLWRMKRIGLSLIGALIIGCWSANFIVTYHYDLFAGPSVIGSNADAAKIIGTIPDYFQQLYIKPYTRISPYLVGMLTGYILFITKENREQHFNKVNLTAGWIFASAITLTSVYGLYHAHPSLIESCFYNALNRTCFALGLCWVILVCLSGYGGPVNKILSFKLFIPLSRLTYCAYLVHPLVIIGYYDSMKTTLYFTHFTMVTLYLGFLVISYGLAFLTTLFFESPIMALEKLIMKRFNKIQ